MQLRQGEVVSLLGPFGQRQDDPAARRGRARGAAPRHDPHRGQGRCSTAATKLEVPAEKRNLGLVFQSYALWPHKTVFDNVAYGLSLRKVGGDDIRGRVDTALKNLGLGQLGDAPAAPALRRPAAARRDRARAGLQPAGDPDGRAAVQPRRQAARGGARVAARADPEDAAVGAGGHARPERGDGDVGPHPAAQQRRDRAAGHAAGDVRPRPRRCSPPTSWAATTASRARSARCAAAPRASAAKAGACGARPAAWQPKPEAGVTGHRDDPAPSASGSRAARATTTSDCRW